MPYLGQAQIVIDQAGLSPGVPGVSRDDGVVGSLVTLRNNDNTNISTSLGGYRWTLYKPRSSAAALSTPNAASCTFTPDVDGTYMVKLLVNEGLKSNQRTTLLFAVRSSGGFRYPAQGEATEANWTSMYTGSANETGWWEDLDLILRTGQPAIDSTALTVSPEPGLPNSRQIVMGAGLSAVDTGAGGTYTINSIATVAPGTELLDDVALQAENIIGTRTVNPPTRLATEYGQVNLGSEVVPARGTQNDYATVGGGLDNLAGGLNSTVGGGTTNTASGTSSAVSGGDSNTASGNYSTVGGGQTNGAAASHSHIGGGQGNDVAVAAAHGTIAGGENNDVGGTAGFVGGGSGNNAGGNYAVVVGGQINSAAGLRAFVGSGGGAVGNSANGENAAVVGGDDNAAGGIAGFVGAGNSNQNAANDAFIGAGNSNSITAGGIEAVICGGDSNSVSATYGSVLGGRNNTVSASDGTAIGRAATAAHSGSIVINTAGGTSQSSSAANEFTVRADGGARVLTNSAEFKKYLASPTTNNYEGQVQGNATTTDATPNTATVVTIPADSDMRVTISLKGKQSGSNNCKSLYYVATYTNNGGAVALVGAAHINDVQNTAGAAGWTASVSISGTNIIVNYTGAVGTTIYWSWDAKLHYGGRI